jgi:RsiW-degrading membrane proteinase PrsW (M82 family)
MNISAIYFFTALITGLLSLALAAVVQVILPQVELDITQGNLLLNALRSALTEEGSRFIMLSLLFVIMPPFKNHESDESVNAAAGMIAGLAFAAVETASLAAANPLAGPVRLISTVFLHAACGIRVALAASTAIARKFSRISSLVLAIALHTVYNFMTPQGGILTILAILLAASSFTSGLRYMNGQKNSGASGR